MNELVIATGNPHKLDEIRSLLRGANVQVLGLHDLDGTFPEPDGIGSTFIENARIKARAYARMTGRRCLADDSGLEVDALGRAPGVHSAHFAGVDGDRATRDAANNRLLLERLRAVRGAPRTARFVCVMCLAEPDGTILAESRGEFSGIIVDAPRGTNGFGYDPHLEIDDGRTSAELSPDEKNARSHRGHALRAMIARMRERGDA